MTIIGKEHSPFKSKAYYIDKKVVETAMRLNATFKQALLVVRQAGHSVCERTFRSWCKKTFGIPYEDAREQYMEGTKLKLKQVAVQMALEGDQKMLIFCLKNLCDWSDKARIDVNNEVTHNVEKLEDFLARTNDQKLLTVETTATKND